VEGEFLSGDLHGMPGVPAAVVAHDDVEVLGEQVNDLAFAFIAPVQADDAGMSKRGEIHIQFL
jgi:hypothetical protein